MSDTSTSARPGLNLQDALHQMIDGVVVIDPHNDIVYFNPAAEALWGYKAREVLGQNVKLLIPSEMRKNHDDWVNRHRTDGKDRIVGSAREVEMEHKDGSRKWVSLGLSQMLDATGQANYVAMVRDITEDRKNRSAQEQARVKSESLDVMRDLLDQIGSLTTSINTIAQQTNLLSVNASIEAARAGDTGRGFALVATEIRSLSNKARDLTSEIEQVVEAGQHSVMVLAGGGGEDQEEAKAKEVI